MLLDTNLLEIGVNHATIQAIRRYSAAILTEHISHKKAQSSKKLASACSISIIKKQHQV
jgi:hypothetical protein